MHELAIATNIIEIASENANGVKILCLTLEIGRLSGVVPDAIQFCLEACSPGTLLEGAQLEIVEIPGLGRCSQCGAEIALELPYGVCHCGSTRLEVVRGQELTIKELVLEENSCVELVAAPTMRA